MSGRVLGLALVFLVASATVAGAEAGGQGPTSVVRLDYTATSALSGAISGHLEVYQARYAAGPPEEVTLADVEGRLLLVTVTANGTRGPTGGVVTDLERPERRVREVPLEQARLRLDWPMRDQHDLLLVAGHDYVRGGNTPLQVEVASSSASASGVYAGAPNSDGEHFWPPPPARVGEADGSVAKPHRIVALAGGAPISLEGGFLLHIRHARIWSDDRVLHEMEPYVQTETVASAAPLAGVSRFQTTFTEGYLYVDRGRVELPPGGAQLSAGDANWTVDGDAVFHGSTGTYRLGDTNGSFARETLGLRGTFELRERVGADSGDTVRADATGSFAALAVDNVVQASGRIGMTLLQQAIWITLLSGTAALMFWILQHAWVFLYARVKPDAVLDHPRRSAIMRFIMENPACHVDRVSNDLGLARGVARHHLMVLVRAGRVRQFRDAGMTMLAPAGRPRDKVLREKATQDRRVATIRELVATGTVPRSELVAMLSDRQGVSTSTARRWIEKAVRMGVVTQEGSGRSVGYRGAF